MDLKKDATGKPRTREMEPMGNIVAALYRHPIKAFGVERVTHALMERGRTMPGDRVWAVLHDKSKYDRETSEWARCTTFLRGARFPSLMAVHANWNDGDVAQGALTLSHPDLADAVTADPATKKGEAAMIAWMDQLIPEGMPRPVALARAMAGTLPRGMTDSSAETVSIMTTASLADLAAKLGVEHLDPRRFRGNIWLDGFEPWSEFDLIGKKIRIGKCVLEVQKRVERCSATLSNPETGKKDLDILAALEKNCGHQDFGIFAEVITTGEIREGDDWEILD